MGPLWYEILGKIDPLQKLNVAGGSSAYFQKMAEQGIPRLALYSGHDSTLMPLLASMGSRVWDGDWTPYASMIIIEVCIWWFTSCIHSHTLKPKRHESKTQI